jgi:hypothetical protein
VKVLLPLATPALLKNPNVAPVRSAAAAPTLVTAPPTSSSRFLLNSFMMSKSLRGLM